VHAGLLSTPEVEPETDYSSVGGMLPYWALPQGFFITIRLNILVQLQSYFFIKKSFIGIPRAIRADQRALHPVPAKPN
jgi:hypothetical protein